jgi:hypothetical protein
VAERKGVLLRLDPAVHDAIFKVVTRRAGGREPTA